MSVEERNSVDPVEVKEETIDDFHTRIAREAAERNAEFGSQLMEPFAISKFQEGIQERPQPQRSETGEGVSGSVPEEDGQGGQ